MSPGEWKTEADIHPVIRNERPGCSIYHPGRSFSEIVVAWRETAGVKLSCWGQSARKGYRQEGRVVAPPSVATTTLLRTTLFLFPHTLFSASFHLFPHLLHFFCFLFIYFQSSSPSFPISDFLPFSPSTSLFHFFSPPSFFASLFPSPFSPLFPPCLLSPLIVTILLI